MPSRRPSKAPPTVRVKDTEKMAAVRSAEGTGDAVRLLAEQVEALRAELEKVRDEVAILRTLVAHRKVSGGAYRGGGDR